MIVTVPELKAHLRIQHDEEEALLGRCSARRRQRRGFCARICEGNARAVGWPCWLMACIYECGTVGKDGYNIMTAAFRACSIATGH
jgi:hypothetical protein